MTALRAVPPHTDDLGRVALHPRNLSFDWGALPLRWIPDEAIASAFINVLHILLPEGERFFVKVFSEALPLIRDERLREEVLGFIGQEGIHASSHQGVQDYFATQGVDTRGYVREVEHLFRSLLADRGLTGRRQEEWLIERLALVAGIEHMTAFLGDWVLNASGLDAAGADPRMLDLLRWHGAEEVEHRRVAYDVYQHLDGRYLRRVRTYALACVGLVYLWARGTQVLLAHDPAAAERSGRSVRLRPWSLIRTARRGLTPGYLRMIRSLARYLAPGYDPGNEGCTEQAVAYLAQSPAALAAAA